MASVPVNTYEPDIVSAPGETLLEVIQDRGMSQKELAGRLGLAVPTLNKIIKGRAPVTHETALALETVLGISASFWNRYEAAYRESLARQEVEGRLAKWREWGKQFPWHQAAALGWIEPCRDLTERVQRILQFFAVKSPEEYENTYACLAVSWRESSKFRSDSAHLAMWLRQGEIRAAAIDCEPYDQAAFREALHDARSLTTVTDPQEFVPQLQDKCRACGVAIALVPELGKTHVSGATRWLRQRTKALIQLSARHRTNDHLWFCFFHEAAHILKHSKRQLFLEDTGETSKQEEEANEFASDILIPSLAFRGFATRQRFPKAAVIEFALRVGIAPGIVVGRLQHEGLVPYRSRLNDLKVRYMWRMSQEQSI